nr:GNAT family N-acetyltransferase [Kibdelosporangium sp. MJ126-NF4]CEL18796.1 Acetyltransferase [Kibdelosporangium sp. MJ126-NF4]CTQ96351.1 Acetyltransferase [Kibdelosporangium sp. MJ126-NF4]
MGIRRISADQTDLRTIEYAFSHSPLPADGRAKWQEAMSYNSDSVVLISEENGVSVAEASAVPLRQNIRGSVYPMAGIAGVAAQPQVRRRGYVRELLTELLGQMRDEGHAVSVLYPFRASFYAKFGYVGLPKPRWARFDPSGLSDLRALELDGETEWQQIGAGYPLYRGLNERLLAQRHGFAVFPESRDVRIRDRDEHWLLTAKSGGEVVGASAYRIDRDGSKAILHADSLLYSNPLGRSLLLQFFAMHADHMQEIAVPVAPDEFPELWATDLTGRIEVKPLAGHAPMGRVLSVEALQGMAVGPGRVGVEIVDDPFIGGKYMLDGTSGRLAVTSGDPEVTLTSAGFAGLVYGVLSPADIVLRGLGTVPDPTGLATLFPRQIPYVFAEF